MTTQACESSRIHRSTPPIPPACLIQLPPIPLRRSPLLDAQRRLRRQAPLLGRRLTRQATGLGLLVELLCYRRRPPLSAQALDHHDAKDGTLAYRDKVAGPYFACRLHRLLIDQHAALADFFNSQ